MSHHKVGINLVETSVSMESHTAMGGEIFWWKKLAIGNAYLRQSIGEMLGTMILVFFGTSTTAQTVLGRGAFGDFTNVSWGWGFGLYLGIMFFGTLGKGIHNPAFTLALAVFGKLDKLSVLFFTVAQFIGAFLGAVLTFCLYTQKIHRFEVGDTLRMNVTGGIFVTAPFESTSWAISFFDQILGTGLLFLVILSVTDGKNFSVPSYLQPLLIGFGFSLIVRTVALNCGGALNPARDLSPRILIAMAGWGMEAFTDNNYFFWIPIVGPYIGALVTGLIYHVVVDANQ